GGGGGQQQATKGGGNKVAEPFAGAKKKVPAQPDPKVGRLKADTCMGCHGIPGYMMVYPTYSVPKLGGQHAEYIVSALQQYKTGERKNSTMQAQALALSDKDMQDIAAYFSSLAPEAPASGGGGGGQQQATKGGGNKVAEASPEATAGGGSAQASGQQTFAQVCSSCHQSGAMGAPKFGSKADWAPRIKKGKQTLYTHAINGFKAMPPKGGQPSLSDADVKAAVDYMVAEVSGGGGGQQQATKGGGNTARKAQPTKAQMGPGIKVAAARGASPASKSTYQAMCSTCHSSGALGAPKITDKAAWQPRIAQGTKVLYSSALNGIGVMPAKGGNPQLSDEQVKAAVDYIVSAVTATTGQTAAAEKSQSGKAKQGQ
ncbi:MAG TPA: c-type cytochrome, partial [Gammaproteobacteria bacterium]|nr:c-type cytochrome [Gammaproteobacteria bacterium]